MRFWTRQGRRGTSGRSGSRSPKESRLRFEPLEQRHLLAPLLGLTVNLYEDAGGVPGAPITDDAVKVGDTFFVEILAEDVRLYAQGVGGLSLDIKWDPAVLREVDALFDPQDPNSPLVTPNFPLFRSGRLDNEAGMIDDLQGASLETLGAGERIGEQGPERFALLKFQAVAQGDLSRFELSLGRGGLGMNYRGRLRSSSLIIERQTISVTPDGSPRALDAVFAQLAGAQDPSGGSADEGSSSSGNGSVATTQPPVIPAWLLRRPIAMRRLGLR